MLSVSLFGGLNTKLAVPIASVCSVPNFMVARKEGGQRRTYIMDHTSVTLQVYI